MPGDITGNQRPVSRRDGVEKDLEYQVKKQSEKHSLIKHWQYMGVRECGEKHGSLTSWNPMQKHCSQSALSPWKKNCGF